MEIEELKIGQTVNIQYITYTNNGSLRCLKNLKVQEISKDLITFVQMSKTLRIYRLGFNEIKSIYEVK